MTTELDPSPTTSAWTADELSSIRAGLVLAIERLETEIALVNDVLGLVVAESTVEVLHDDLDVANHRLELMQDAVQAENSAAILEQTQHVLARLDGGLYGACEECSGAIGRPRLEAFPRATLCMSCVG
jgi:DnaK suppressor protein